jgi:hypothetical protein
MTRSKSSRSQASALSGTSEQPHIKVVKTEVNESGEAVQLVRPYSESSKSKGEIVDELVSQFNYKKSSEPIGSK